MLVALRLSLGLVVTVFFVCVFAIVGLCLLPFAPMFKMARIFIGGVVYGACSLVAAWVGAVSHATGWP